MNKPDNTSKATVLACDPGREYFFREGCFILELLNSANHPDLSIARARVAPGVSTLPHLLQHTIERYLIESGQGRVFLGEDLDGIAVSPGDVVVIPASVRQWIRNTGETDLVFHVICTPRFLPENYVDVSDQRSN